MANWFVFETDGGGNEITASTSQSGVNALTVLTALPSDGDGMKLRLEMGENVTPEIAQQWLQTWLHQIRVSNAGGVR